MAPTPAGARPRGRTSSRTGICGVADAAGRWFRAPPNARVRPAGRRDVRMRSRCLTRIKDVNNATNGRSPRAAVDNAALATFTARGV